MLNQFQAVLRHKLLIGRDQVLVGVESGAGDGEGRLRLADQFHDDVNFRVVDYLLPVNGCLDRLPDPRDVFSLDRARTDFLEFQATTEAPFQLASVLDQNADRPCPHRAHANQSNADGPAGRWCGCTAREPCGFVPVHGRLMNGSMPTEQIGDGRAALANGDGIHHEPPFTIRIRSESGGSQIPRTVRGEAYEWERRYRSKREPPSGRWTIFHQGSSRVPGDRTRFAARP